MMEPFPTEFEIRVPGSTSNLGAGFDTLGLALQLFLNVHVITQASQVKIELSGEGAMLLPPNDENLIYQAYLLACRNLGIPPQPLVLKVHNEIPIQRGLGSSGAATAAGLAIARVLSSKLLPDDLLLQWGNQIEGHPENVSASLLGGLTVNCPVGNQSLSLKINPPNSLFAVALIPELTISTKAARELLPQKIPFKHAVENVQRAALFVAAFTAGKYEWLKEAAQDHLHQPYRKKLIPGFEAFIQSAYSSGAIAVFLSGSGSTLLALVDTGADPVAAAMKAVAKRQPYRSECKILALDSEGLTITRLKMED